MASTKGFLTQLVACYLLGLYLAQVRGTKFGDEIKATMRELQSMPAAITAVLDDIEPVLKLAADFADEPSVLFLGRHVGYPVALEGALKLKELAYIHAEGFAAGELKHGPIALIEDRLPVFVVMPPRGRDMLHDKVVSNLQEVRARGAKTVVLAEEDDHEVDRVRRRADQAAQGVDPAAAAGGHGAVADVRLRAGHPQGPRRGPAAQPGQVRHRGVS